MKYILLFFSLTVFAQKPSEVFPVYSQPKSRPISIDNVILHIRELKTQSSVKYGEAVDFYFRKIVSAGKNQWIEKLEEFSQDPHCPAINRIKINEYILRLRSLQIGEIAPDIVIGNFRLSNLESEKSSILILFYSPSCFHCTELIIDLIPFSVKKNLTVIALQIDEDMNPFVFPENWKSIKADAEIRKIYGVISTPTLFLLNSKSRRISAIPENLSEIEKSEHLF